jgi:hypothetical protein
MTALATGLAGTVVVLLVGAMRLLIWLAEVAWRGRDDRWRGGELLGFGLLCLLPVALAGAAYALAHLVTH